jgi:hypothetical protein
MPACEKCWSDAAFLAFNSNADQATIYASLVNEREKTGNPCTPEQQCGELHVVVEWADSEPMCRCEHASKRDPHDPA